MPRMHDPGIVSYAVEDRDRRQTVDLARGYNEVCEGSGTVQFQTALLGVSEKFSDFERRLHGIVDEDVHSLS